MSYKYRLWQRSILLVRANAMNGLFASQDPGNTCQ